MRIFEKYYSMRRLFSLIAFCSLVLRLDAVTDPKLLLIEHKLQGFSDRQYSYAIDRVLEEFEKQTGVGLKPGKLGKCGLKISSQSGLGLATPKPLIRALSQALEKRGFDRASIILCDSNVQSLRECGFLPPLRTDPQTFEGLPVIAFEAEATQWAKDKKLCYENQVMPRPGSPTVAWGDNRISVLPKTLFDEVDFWINLPVISDSKALGVFGAIGSASLGSIANSERFNDNPANASKVAIEVCAIPELSKKNILNIVSFENFQVLGGPSFDASWCKSEKTILASANPVILDYIGLQKINGGRTERNVEPIRPEPAIFSAANNGEIQLGTCRPADITLIKLKAE
jgi:hypothetical protein